MLLSFYKVDSDLKLMNCTLEVLYCNRKEEISMVPGFSVFCFTLAAFMAGTLF